MRSTSAGISRPGSTQKPSAATAATIVAGGGGFAMLLEVFSNCCVEWSGVSMWASASRLP